MSEKIIFHAFTTKNDIISNRLLSEVEVFANDKKYKTVALWDTGATGTCISDDVVKNLDLVATGRQTIMTPSGSKDVNTYLVDIGLPNHVMISSVMVCDSDIGKQKIGVLLGMDIITTGDFCISNFNGKTVFSFRIPSKKTTDYVLEINVENLTGTHGKGKRKHK